MGVSSVPTRWRFILILTMLTMLLTIPAMVAASETVSYSATTVPVITASQHGTVELGSLVIEVDPLAKGEHSALVALPSGYSILAQGRVQSIEDPHLSLDIFVTSQQNEFKVYLDYDGEGQKLTFVIPIKTTVPQGTTGDIQLEITGLQGQFTDGKVIVGRTAGGQLALTNTPFKVHVIRPETEVPFSIEVAEDRGGVLRAGTETIKLVLQEGFAWQTEKTKVEILAEGGYQPVTRVDAADQRVLYVDILGQETRSKGSFLLTGQIMAERTLFAEASVRAEVTGKDLASSLTLVIAQVVKPAYEARFFVGRDLYFSNGNALTLDVPPYLKEGRIFLPLRYVGLSLGVDPKDIEWNGQVATLTLGDKTVQVRPGVNQILVNGQAVAMDVAAEVQFPGRVMLPYRFIAEAFGATVNWDAPTRTVTMEL